MPKSRVRGAERTVTKKSTTHLVQQLRALIEHATRTIQLINEHGRTLEAEFAKLRKSSLSVH